MTAPLITTRMVTASLITAPWAISSAGAKSLPPSGAFRKPGAPRRMDTNMPETIEPTRRLPPPGKTLTTEPRA